MMQAFRIRDRLDVVPRQGLRWTEPAGEGFRCRESDGMCTIQIRSERIDAASSISGLT